MSHPIQCVMIIFHCFTVHIVSQQEWITIMRLYRSFLNGVCKNKVNSTKIDIDVESLMQQ